MSTLRLTSQHTRLCLSSMVLISNLLALFPLYLLLFVAVMMTFATAAADDRLISDLWGLFVWVGLGLPTTLAVLVTRRLRPDARALSIPRIVATTLSFIGAALAMTQHTPSLRPLHVPVLWSPLLPLMEALGAIFKNGETEGLLVVATAAFVGGYIGSYWPRHIPQ